MLLLLTLNLIECHNIVTDDIQESFPLGITIYDQFRPERTKTYPVGIIVTLNDRKGPDSANLDSFRQKRKL